MTKHLLFFLTFLSFCTTAFEQTSNNKMLFVIDSIPLLANPEDWNQILYEDIADMNVIKNKDSLKLLGWAKLEGITYIFTKEYRKRPDSIKQIPSLKQMNLKNYIWYLHDAPYTGRYIDYYNSGRIQDEGTLSDGRLNGALTVYFRAGNKKSVSGYKDGTLHGVENYFYKNGA